MTKLEYFKYAIKNKLLDKLDWYFSILTTPMDKVSENKYFVVINGVYKVKTNDGNIEITDATTDNSLFNITDSITLTNNDMVNIKTKVDTHIGIAITNYLLLVSPFNNKIEYINNQISIKDIENIIAKRLTNDKNDVSGILISEYVKFVDNVGFMTNFSRIVSISTTEKAILPPPGITEFKNNLIKEMKNKYGEDVFTDYVRVAEFEKALKDYDSKWLEDDPSYGKLLSGKIKNTSRAKLFLTYGAEAGFDRSGKAMLVTNSLNEGWPDDPKELTRMYNASRAGSYDRGAETQKGGVTAKVVLRATNSMKIIDGDCGSTIGKDLYVDKNNKDKIIGRNIISGSKIIGITKDNVDSYLGKKITLRSPAYCHQSENNICSTCAGERLTSYRDGISLLVLNVSGILLYISMAAMHAVELKLVELDMDEHIR